MILGGSIDNWDQPLGEILWYRGSDLDTAKCWGRFTVDLRWRRSSAR